MHKILLCTLLLAALAWPAGATLDGSLGELLAPGTVDPGDFATFTFHVANGSPDGESIREVKILMPGDTDVLAGSYDDLGQNWNLDFTIQGAWDNFAVFTHAGGPGGIAPGEEGYFYVDTFIHLNVDCGPMSLDVRLYGDEVGGAPHWINFDDLPFQACGVPVLNGTWSRVKGLYE